MKRKVEIDKQKSKSLIKMAKITLERLGDINSLKYPSNTLNDYYNIIHQLAECICCSYGFKFSGDGAHAELLNFIFSEKFEFSESEKLFSQELRVLRNRISYEGFFIQEEYLKRNEIKIKNIIDKLLKIGDAS